MKSGKSLHDNIAVQFMNSIFTNALPGQSEDAHTYTLKERFNQANEENSGNNNINNNGEENMGYESNQNDHIIITEAGVVEEAGIEKEIEAKAEIEIDIEETIKEVDQKNIVEVIVEIIEEVVPELMITENEEEIMIEKEIIIIQTEIIRGHIHYFLMLKME